MQTKKAAMILAEGFEETEAVVVIDVLRRAGVDVALVGLADQEWVVGSHGLRLGLDHGLDGLEVASLDLLVLPGGMPGTRNLAAAEGVVETLKAADQNGLVIGAICAAPSVLAVAGLLGGRRVTCYPGIEEELPEAVYTGARVEKDGRLITANGPGSAFDFAFMLLTELGLNRAARRLRKAMLVD